MRECPPTEDECSRAITVLTRHRLGLHEDRQTRLGGASGLGSSPSSTRVGEGAGQGAKGKKTRPKGKGKPTATVSVPPSSSSASGGGGSKANKVDYQYPAELSPVLVAGPPPYYRCPLRRKLKCQYTAVQCDTVRGHVRQEHYGTRVYQCPYCVYTGAAWDHLRRHLSRCPCNPQATECGKKKKPKNRKRKHDDVD